MKVFIGWSGETSKQIAERLREWIPKVNAHIEAFVSFEDIGLGVNWSETLTEQLKRASYGILCITPDNLKAQWLFYEAGILEVSTSLNNPDGKSRVAPLQFGMEHASDLPSPLSHYQSGKFGYDAMWNLTRHMNVVCRSQYAEKLGGAGDNEQVVKTYLELTELKERFDALYSELERKVTPILRNAPPVDPNIQKADVMRILRNALPVCPGLKEDIERLLLDNSSVNPQTPPDTLTLFEEKLNEVYKNFGVFPEIARIYYEGNLILDQFDPFQKQSVSQMERGEDLIRFRNILSQEIENLTNSLTANPHQRRERIKILKELRDIVNNL